MRSDPRFFQVLITTRDPKTSELKTTFHDMMYGSVGEAKTEALDLWRHIENVHQLEVFQQGNEVCMFRWPRVDTEITLAQEQV